MEPKPRFRVGQIVEFVRDFIGETYHGKGYFKVPKHEELVILQNTLGIVSEIQKIKDPRLDKYAHAKNPRYVFIYVVVSQVSSQFIICYEHELKRVRMDTQ